jgi:hypothetical protein
MSCGPAGLDDAAASLRDAMREAQDDTAPVAALGLALALDRRGQTSEAHAVLVDRARLLLPSDPAAGLATSRARELLSVAPDERDALVALATEATNPARARGAWLAIVASNPAGPWAAHARMHLAALGDKHSRGTP